MTVRRLRSPANGRLNRPPSPGKREGSSSERCSQGKGAQKERGRHKAGPSPIRCCEASYPLVTTGGGALPLPV